MMIWSSCNSVVEMSLKQSVLPERVCMICGDRAYSCVPFSQAQGTGYLAYLISLIRRVNSNSQLRCILPLHRHRREISKSQQVASVLLPWYGMYITQQELLSLSHILENHFNVQLCRIVWLLISSQLPKVEFVRRYRMLFLHLRCHYRSNGHGSQHSTGCQGTACLSWI